MTGDYYGILYTTISYPILLQTQDGNMIKETTRGASDALLYANILLLYVTLYHYILVYATVRHYILIYGTICYYILIYHILTDYVILYTTTYYYIPLA